MILILKAYQDLCVEACVTHFWESKLLPREDLCSRVCLEKKYASDRPSVQSNLLNGGTGTQNQPKNGFNAS